MKSPPPHVEESGLVFKGSASSRARLGLDRVEAASKTWMMQGASYYVPREPGKLPGASLRHFDDEARQKVAEAAGSLLNDFVWYGDPADTTVGRAPCAGPCLRVTRATIL